MIGRIRSLLESVLAVADRTVARVARAATSWAIWPALIGLGFAIAIWAQRNAPKIAKHQTNKLPDPDRLAMFRGVEIGIAVVVLAYLLVVVARRVRAGSWSAIDTFGRMNRVLAPLAALPLIAWLRGPNVEKDSPKLTLFFAAVIAALVGYGAYSWGHGGRGGELVEQDEESRGARLYRIADRAGRWLAPLSVAGLWAAYGFFFSRLAITNHHALNTRTTDLGYYDNIFYQSIHGKFLGCSFIKAGYHGSAHFDPILALLSPIYLLYPRAELLLALQAVWLGQGVVPVYLLAREKLRGRWAPVLLAAMWAAYPALQGANMYEFHSLTLISPLVVWLLYFYERGARVGYWITLALLLLCREDVALLMCFVGLAAAVDRREGRPRVAWLTIAISLAYFTVVKRRFMTSADVFMTSPESYSFAYYYDEMMPDKSNGLMGIVVSLVTNPAFALKLMLEEAKVVFLLQLFLPLAFLPLLAKPGRWMLVYGLVFCLLASRDPVSSIYFQYSAVIFPIAFALTPEALRRIEASGAPALLGIDEKRLARAALAAAVAASIIVSWKFGGIVDNAAFRGGFVRVARTLTPQQVTNYAWVREQVAKIPPGASVAATNRLGAHISNRKAAFFYSGSYTKTAEYVFIDEAELKGADLERHKAAVSHGELVELGRLGKMALFKRDPAVKPVPFTPSAPTATGLGNAGPPKGRDAGAPPPDQDPRGMEEPDEEPPRSP